MFVNDEKKKFEELFRQFYFSLRTYAYRFVQSTTVAEDIVQDVFSQLWSSRSTQKQSLKAYLFTSVRNSSLNYLKRQQIEKKYLTSFDQNTIESLYQSAVIEMQKSNTDELMKMILENIDSLPKQTKQIFLLSRKYKMKNNEIAEFLEISIKTVEKHITIALQTLREKLRNYL